MAVRLYDPEFVSEIMISGTKFRVKQLDQAQSSKLFWANKSFLGNGEDAQLDSIKDVLASAIVTVDLAEWKTWQTKCREFLDRLSFLDLLSLSSKVMELNVVSDGEAKNSGGSPSAQSS